MGEPAHHRFTFDQYLMLEEDSGSKHEFLDGQVWAMSGGSPDHAAVAGNVLTLLNVQLSGKKCRVFTSDLRVRVVATGLGTYPDVSVVCGRVELDPEDAKRHTVITPRRGDCPRRPRSPGDRGGAARRRWDLVAPPRWRRRARAAAVRQLRAVGARGLPGSVARGVTTLEMRKGGASVGNRIADHRPSAG